jgi:hypothetical protein
MLRQAQQDKVQETLQLANRLMMKEQYEGLKKLSTKESSYILTLFC